MHHKCGRALAEKVLHVFNEDSKATDKRCSAVKTFNHDSKTDGQLKVKRLKTRKERSQMKAGWKETSKTKSYHHHCHRQSRKDMAFFQNCCHNSCHQTSRKNTPISSTIPAPQEPSIITDGRLIGHHGLFNHEVKSIDIERLLSKHSKREQIGQQVEEKSSDNMHLPSTLYIPAALSRDDVVGANSGDTVPFEKKVGPASKTHDNNQEIEVKTYQFNNQGYNISPGQRQQEQLDLSSGSCKSNLSCKHNIQNLEITKTNNNVPSGKDSESLLTPSADAENVKTLNCQRQTISDLEQPHQNRDHQTQTDSVNLNPFSLSSSPTTNCFDILYQKQDPEYVSESVSVLAAQLCERLHLPLLKRRNLLSEIRKELLKSLQERHGSSLQANLNEVQQWVRFGMGPTQTTQDQECTRMEEDKLLLSDTPVKMTRSKHFNWKSTGSPQPHQSLHQTAEWLANPVDTSASLLNESFIPSLSPQFYMDFEQFGSSASGLFSQSPTLCRERKASPSDHWEDIFSKSKSEESVLFDSFKNSFTTHTREVGESSQKPQYQCRNIQPLFPCQAHLSHGHSEEPLHFMQEQDPFGTDTHSFVPFFASQIHYSPQRSHLQPFSQFSQTSTRTSFRSHLNDVMHYPPSHMLENSPPPPSSSFSSPDRWSFPPMRLY